MTMPTADSFIMEFSHITPEIIEATRKEWLRQVDKINQEDDIVLPSNYERVVDWADKSIRSEEEVYAQPHGVLTQGEETMYAKAILKLTYARNRTPPYIKLLEIHLEPRLDLEGRDQIGYALTKEARRVVSQALINSLKLTFDKFPSPRLKVYGRTEQMRSFYDLIVVNIEESDFLPEGLDVERQGSWLVLNKS
jgi:hypothetical protein